MPWAQVIERLEREDAWPAREPVGSSLIPRESSKPKVPPLADTSENAPLLMRIVRHPFELLPVRFVRVEHRGVDEERPHPGSREPALAYRQELREDTHNPNPMMVFAHRPEHRPQPFLRARLAGGADE